MSKTFEQGREDVEKLCRYFETNRQAFLAPGVKEAHVRQSLIDPLFEALGWDVRNTAMNAPQYREVIPEDSLDVEGQQKAPDYAFRVGAQAKFYAEAKKCGVNINADPGPAYQLRRYGWSAKIALSLLTDFEELAVYDCTQRPHPGDKASRARIQYFRFEEYPERWRELWDVFSREAVWSGAFDQYAASKRKRGTSEVDVEFLKEIEGWRDVLARNIALRNEDLSSDDLNAAVQRTIDRIVFLRMAEDRGIEPFEQILKLCERPDIYPRFMRELCRKADDKYNSGLFHFQKESGISEDPDRITPKLTIDDKVIKPILQSLYFAYGSPYHFGVMPVEILGTVYERFLGKVIRLTAGHQAKVEEKPEVRKAGGVYYTPAYIVEYIVKYTVGKQIEGKSPAGLAGEKGQPVFRVLDMACGSGSFLLGAYQLLLDHCLKWYIEHKPDTHQEAVYQDPRDGHWRLTIKEKKRILTTHIFGVDIDLQAVEVSKLSLLLKALEGEDSASLSRQLEMFHSRALPNLSDNIKCGNSLIGADYFTGKLIADPNEMKRVNPFDWKQGFPDAIKAGGFDCIIGNPPYIRIQVMKEWAPLEVEIYKKLFRAASAGNHDIYVVFIEQALKLLNINGQLGFICPHKFFNAKYGAPLRQIIANGRHLSHIVHFGDQQVFAGATNYTCLLFLEKERKENCDFVKVHNIGSWKAQFINGNGNDANNINLIYQGLVPAEQVTGEEWNFHVGNGSELFKKLSLMPTRLGAVARIFQGLVTGADYVFVLGSAKSPTKKLLLFQKETGETFSLERELLRPFISHTTVDTYKEVIPAHWLLFPYEIHHDKAVLLPESILKSRFPNAFAFLRGNFDSLRNREGGKWRHVRWYSFGRTQNLTEMDAPKLIVQVISNRGRYAYDAGGAYFTGGGNGPYYGVRWKDPADPHSLHYLQAILSSPLLDFYLRRVSSPFRGGYWSYGKRFIEQLPIRRIDFKNPRDNAAHDRMVNLVESMLVLHKQLAAAKSEAQKEVTQRQIDATDQEIDRLVYELYGLTEEEIAIVEGKGQ